MTNKIHFLVRVTYKGEQLYRDAYAVSFEEALRSLLRFTHIGYGGNIVSVDTGEILISIPDEKEFVPYISCAVTAMVMTEDGIEFL